MYTSIERKKNVFFIIIIINYRREPTALIAKESKSDSTEEDKVSEGVKSQKPCATRHLIFIRHGQYNLDGANDEERYLTKLGNFTPLSTPPTNSFNIFKFYFFPALLARESMCNCPLCRFLVYILMRI